MSCTPSEERKRKQEISCRCLWRRAAQLWQEPSRGRWWGVEPVMSGDCRLTQPPARMRERAGEGRCRGGAGVALAEEARAEWMVLAMRQTSVWSKTATAELMR